jgi:hypothetical protein
MERASRSSPNGVLLLLLLLTLFGQLSACRKPTRDNLIGSYWIEDASYRMKLKLYGDGTFDQFFQKQVDGKTITRTGTWELTDFEGPSVLLKGALVVRDAVGTIESEDRKGGLILRIEKSFGHFRLISSEDQGLYLEKNRE